MYKKYSKYVPIAIKISPDLSKQELYHISNQLIKYKIDAVIATNTTLDRSLISGLDHSLQHGGLSGLALQKKSTNTIRILSKKLNQKIPIIGVGGINSLNASREKIKAGATLIQIYSGLIYHGPKLIKKIIENI